MCVKPLLLPHAGSPPRLWGAPCGHRHGIERRRFTPTPVGSAMSASPCSSVRPVHPHACGERQTENISASIQPGSPPRLWGARLDAQAFRQCRRFTPTPVGSASGRVSASSSMSVHPHACGERFGRPLRHAVVGGSPPRLWGAPGMSFVQAEPTRFTPTPVGSARPPPTSISCSPVHPHACGERSTSRR